MLCPVKTLCKYGCMYFLAALMLVCVDVIVMSSAYNITCTWSVGEGISAVYVFMGSQIHKIFLLQKRAIRNISESNFRAHTEPLFKEHNSLKVYDIYHNGNSKILLQIS